jgi:DNA-binding transcriptional MerR regulator
VEQLLLVRKWQLAGLSLERIGEVLKQQTSGPLPPAPRRKGTVEVWSHLVVADGVEVTLDPGRASLTPEQVRAFFRGVAQVYEQIENGKEER